MQFFKNVETVRMIPNPNLVSIIMAFFGVLFFIILTLLPSIIELKRPEDPGPKIIIDYDLIYLHNLDVKTPHESELTSFSTLREVAAILALLPDIES
ncbi:MAG: hypothetical protein QW734_04340 [Candidatus Bathyarchaeia archaeon]